jgi:hypothetical protein
MNRKTPIGLIGLAAAIMGITAFASIAAASLTFSGAGVTANSAVVIDGSSTISIGTSTATGITIGNDSSTTIFGGNVAVGNRVLSGSLMDLSSTLQKFVNGGGENNFSSINSPQGTVNVELQSDGTGGILALDSAVLQTGANKQGYAIEGDALGSANGVQLWGISAYTELDGAVTAQDMRDFWAFAPAFNGGGTTPTYYAYWSDGLTGLGITNPYFSWFDSQGVGRCKDDSSFNSVDQSICVVYNPLFTKYTPGASNFERIVYGEWNSNVAEMGTEAGGTGTLQPLDLMGSKIGIGLTGASPSTTLQVAGTLPTIRVGASSLSGCVEMGNSDNSAGINYITVLNGVLSATTTKPSNCQ